MSKSFGARFTTRPVLRRSGDSWEPPSADPLARWCGGWGRKAPGYPISIFIFNYGVLYTLQPICFCAPVAWTETIATEGCTEVVLWDQPLWESTR